MARLKLLDRRMVEIEKALAMRTRMPRGTGGKEQLKIELAMLEAQREIKVSSPVDIQSTIDAIEEELGSRNIPYHGSRKAAYENRTAKQLDAQLRVYYGETKVEKPNLHGPYRIPKPKKHRVDISKCCCCDTRPEFMITYHLPRCRPLQFLNFCPACFGKTFPVDAKKLKEQIKGGE